MSPSEQHLTVGEHQRSTQALERVINTGFSRMDGRFDGITDILQDHGARLAVLEEARKQERRSLQKKTVGWGSAIAGFVMLLVEIGKQIGQALAKG